MLFTSLFVASLSSCNYLDFLTLPETSEPATSRALSVHSLFDEEGEAIASWDEGEADEAQVVFLEGKELMPLITLEGYASLYSPYMKEGYRSEFESEGSVEVWKVYKVEEEEEDKLAFATAISFLTGEIALGGDISSFINIPRATNTEALMFGLRVKNDIKNKEEAKNACSYRYAPKDFAYKKIAGKNYIPLGLFDSAYSSSSGVTIAYDYSGIICYTDYDQLKAEISKGDEEPSSVLARMGKWINGGTMPRYLAEFNRNCFFFVMDNFYGLADNLGVSSMRTHYLNSTYASDFLSEDPLIRQRAYTRALNELDDGHTGLGESAAIWNETAEGNYPRNGKTYDRNILRETLKIQRSAAYEAKGLETSDIMYSDTGKTATFVMDAFTFAPSLDEVVSEDRTSYLDGASTKDTAIALGQALSEVANNPTAENVVIDISTNGGGTIGVLLKTLALLSKENKAELAFRDGAKNYCYTYESSYDWNLDGVYDEQDCFGDDLNIFILTSPFSFSCANAFAYASSFYGTSTTMGVRSGGGECSVASHMLPNFQKIIHSSNSHIGAYDDENNAFFGDEFGASAQIKLDYGSFYDIEKLELAIENSEK